MNSVDARWAIVLRILIDHSLKTTSGGTPGDRGEERRGEHHRCWVALSASDEKWQIAERGDRLNAVRLVGIVGMLTAMTMTKRRKKQLRFYCFENCQCRRRLWLFYFSFFLGSAGTHGDAVRLSFTTLTKVFDCHSMRIVIENNSNLFTVWRKTPFQKSKWKMWRNNWKRFLCVKFCVSHCCNCCHPWPCCCTCNYVIAFWTIYGYLLKWIVNNAGLIYDLRFGFEWLETAYCLGGRKMTHRNRIVKWIVWNSIVLENITTIWMS